MLMFNLLPRLALFVSSLRQLHLDSVVGQRAALRGWASTSARHRTAPGVYVLDRSLEVAVRGPYSSSLYHVVLSFDYTAYDAEFPRITFPVFVPNYNYFTDLWIRGLFADSLLMPVTYASNVLLRPALPHRLFTFPQEPRSLPQITIFQLLDINFRQNTGVNVQH